MDDRSKPWARTRAYFRRARESAAERRNKNKAIRGEALRHINREMFAAGIDQPPTDLHRLAERLGIRQIRYTALAMRARLIVSSGNIVAEINEDLDRFARQHSLAHELAHVVLERDRISLASNTGHNVRREGSSNVIEQLCDACADEMLCPREWLAKRLEDPATSLTSVVEIASQASLPVEFVIRRAIELELKPWQAMWFQRDKGKIQILKSEPNWGDTFLTWIDVENSPQSPLQRCWESDAVSQGELSLRIEGKTQRYAAECIKIADRVAVSVLYLGRSFPST